MDRYVSANQYHCSVCLKYFHTRPRLLNHIKYRAVICATHILKDPPLLSEDEAKEANVNTREHNRYIYSKAQKRDKAEIPNTRVLGPVINLGLPPSRFHFVHYGHNYKFV